jgi:putative ABC transport system ATP-binding protein
MPLLPMIRLEDISRRFRVGDQTVDALSGVNLNIEAGDYVSIMGPSGSGKSTLLNLLGLLDRASAGRYFLNGRDVTALSDEERALIRNTQIGFVFQAFHLVPRLNAAENVELPLLLAGVPAQQRRTRVARVLDALGLAERAHHKPEQLSGGQRQRVAIARATVTEPSVLLADEPTGNLDLQSGLTVVDTLETLHERDITLIVVTHDSAIGSRARRRIKMVDGRITVDQNSSHARA